MSPIHKGGSKKTVSKNIKEMVKSSTFAPDKSDAKRQEMAIAAALDKARKSGAKIPKTSKKGGQKRGESMKKLIILLGTVAILILMTFLVNAWRIFDNSEADREYLQWQEDRQNLRDLNQWRLKEEREDLLRQHQEAIDQIEDRRRSRQDRYDWERDEYGEDY